MSKASEWAAHTRNRPTYLDTPPSGDAIALRAQVTDNGGFYLYVGGNTSVREVQLPPDQAVRLARWILDTFVEGSDGQ